MAVGVNEQVKKKVPGYAKKNLEEEYGNGVGSHA